jgi:Mg2+ and Co2+ transporter CorA
LEDGPAVLRVNERKRISSSIALISQSGLEKISTIPRLVEAGPSVPLIARDAFVVETATKIDQLQATIRLLARDVDALASKVSELEHGANQDQRWFAFQQGEKRIREAKLDEMLRRFRNLKARLDKMDARSNGDYHAYNSFEAVSRKIAELEHFKDEARRVERNVTFRAWLFCGALAASAVILVMSNIIPG